MKYTDLPTDPADIAQDTEDFFEKLEDLPNGDAGEGEGDDNALVDLVLIVAQQDPLELVLGQPDENGVQKQAPRWTTLQQKVILAARDQLDAWKD